MIVEMGMGVDQISVPMQMLMDQIDLKQQRQIAQNLAAGPVGHQTMLFAEYQRPVGEDRNDIKIMRGGKNRLSGTVQINEQFHQPVL